MRRVAALGLTAWLGVLGCTPESVTPPHDPRCVPLCEVEPAHFDLDNRGIDAVCQEGFVDECVASCGMEVEGLSEACAECVFERGWSTYDVYARTPLCEQDPVTFEDRCTFFSHESTCSFTFTSAEGYTAGVDQCIAELYGEGPAVAQCDASVASIEFCEDVCD